MKKTKTMAFSNLIGSIVFIVLGIWAWIQTTSFQEVNGTYVQASAFPQIMIIGMLIFSVVLLIQSVYKLATMKENDPLAAPTGSIDVIHDVGVRGALAVMVLCIFFVVCFKSLGYVVCGTVIAAIIMYIIGKRNFVQMILVSFLVPMIMWLLFYKVLTVNIPLGPLTFIRDFLDTI